MTMLKLVGSRYFIRSVLARLTDEFNHDGHAYSVQDTNGVVAAHRGQVHRVVADAYAEVAPYLACHNGYPYSWRTWEV